MNTLRRIAILFFGVVFLFKSDWPSAKPKPPAGIRRAVLFWWARQDLNPQPSGYELLKKIEMAPNLVKYL